jgi:hypothetical protein
MKPTSQASAAAWSKPWCTPGPIARVTGAPLPPLQFLSEFLLEFGGLEFGGPEFGGPEFGSPEFGGLEFGGLEFGGPPCQEETGMRNDPT